MRARTGGNETGHGMIALRQRRKVGLPLVRESPILSLTGDLSSTPMSVRGGVEEAPKHGW